MSAPRLARSEYVETMGARSAERAGLDQVSDDLASLVMGEARRAVGARARALGWQPADAEDVTSVAVVAALAALAAGEVNAPVEAARLGAFRAVQRTSEERTRLAPPVSDDAVAAAEGEGRLDYWTPAAPDAGTRTTWTDRVSDALDVLTRDDDQVGALGAWIDSLGSARPTPVALRPVAEDARTAGRMVLAREAWQRNVWRRPTGEAPAPAPERTDAPGRAGKAHPYREVQTAGLVVTRARTGQAWVTLDDRSVQVSDDQAREILARTALDGATYRPTPADRAADDWAYATTPMGPVRQSSSVKRKRDGGLGGSATMRGPRHDWSTRSTRV